ncbi:MAG: N-acetylneuraminate synthase family protein [Vicinamibacterales bacterium]
MQPEMEMRLGGQVAGPGHPLLVVAELGLNHGGSVDRALAMVDAAAAAGAGAIKLQTLTAAALVAPGAPPPAHVDAASMVDFFRRFELDEAAHRCLAERARAHGLAVLATPLSEAAVPMLERIGVDGYKIASGDITWDGLIRRAAATRKPVVISTGMATLGEAQRALVWALRGGAPSVALLHCVSAYPVPAGHENLRAIATLGMACQALVGLSDHGADTFALPLAVAMGASIYERHLMLSADDDAVDADVSSTPAELAAAVRAAARAGAALGAGAVVCLPVERANLEGSRRGLYARRALAAGEVVTAADVIALRPAAGLGADRERELVGARLSRAIAAGAPFVTADLPHAGGTEHVA